MKFVLWILPLVLGFTIPTAAQEQSGFMFPSRLGLSYQEKVGIDVGLISFNRFNDRSLITYYDVSLGAESYFVKPFVIAPKLSFDFGMGDSIMFGGGTDISFPTDFSKSTWMLTPKIGINIGSIIRLYYGYNLFAKNNVFPDIGKHRVSLEINMSSFHSFKLGL